jgi:hypothetical protein
MPNHAFLLVILMYKKHIKKLIYLLRKFLLVEM